MPLAPVSEDNAPHVHLYYEDSGVPPNTATYTSLVVLHGTGFHGGKLVYLLHSSVILTMRSDQRYLRDSYL